MKNLILALALVFGITTFAQERKMGKENREKLTPQERVEFQVKRLTKELDLSTKQAEQVKSLMTKKSEARETKKKEMEAKRASGTKPTAEEREAMKTRMQNEVTSLKTEMKTILSAEQYTKWEQNFEDRKDKMMEKRADKKGNKGRK